MPPSPATWGGAMGALGWSECTKVSGRAGREDRAGESWEGCWKGRLWVQELGIPTCDLWGLHHSFLEEGFCLSEGQECL